MGRTFTRDDVLRLAPDASSAKSGQDLAQVRKWVTLASCENVLWGECQGSGAKPYQVQIDLTEPAFKCSCPSRKFPCKHGLGLLLIYATSPDAVTNSEYPAWVAEWLASRQARAAKAAEKQNREPQQFDPAAQAKRRKKRIETAREGLESLASWMQDLIRSGLGAVPSKGYDFFDSQARRLVDAQAPGVARMIRSLSSLASQGANWHRGFVEELSRIHLLTRATARYDQLPDLLRSDIEATIGITTSSEELKTLSPVLDRWQVVAQEVEFEDRLRVQRSWLNGVQSGRTALLFQFAHGSSAFETMIAPGTEWEGELVFFPGNSLRAAVRLMPAQITPLTTFAGCATIEILLDKFSKALSDYPWLERLCVPLNNVTPTMIADNFWLVDSVGDSLPVKLNESLGYSLLAISGGHPVDAAVEYDGQMLYPLSVISQERWTSLAATLTEEATDA